MSKKILFINSSFFDEEDRIPLGLLSLATILDKNKFDVEIIDFLYLYKTKKLIRNENYEDNINQMVDYIISKSPSIVDFYTLCNSYHVTLTISKKIREKNKDIKIVFGGPQVTHTCVDSMNTYPWIDVIGLGEGERTILPLMNSLINNKDLSNIEGIIFRKGKEIINTGFTELIEDLDELDELNYKFVDMNFYEAVTIDVGRGCPYSCTYCATNNFWKKKFRLKSPERIIKEIKYLKDTFGITLFGFIHDLFTVDKKKVLKLCNLLIKENLNINWRCSARADTLDEELIYAMKAAGCVNIFLGIETGSPRMQRIMNKNLNIDNAIKTIEIINKVGIDICASFIYGFPEETIDDVRDTLKVIHQLTLMDIFLIQFHVLTVNPSTHIYNQVSDKLHYSGAMSEFCGVTGVEESKNTFILNNQSIFSNFFDFDCETRTELRYLDRFMGYVYPKLTKNFRKTYLTLMEYYNNDIISMFYDFTNVNTNKLNDRKIIFNHDQLIDLLKNYISNNFFGKSDELIKEIFRFELDIMDFLYHSNDPIKIVDYKFNVYKLKSKNLLINTSTKIQFKRIDEENINLKQII